MSSDKLLQDGSRTPPSSTGPSHVPLFDEAERKLEHHPVQARFHAEERGALRDTVGQKPWVALMLAGLSGWAAAALAMKRFRSEQQPQRTTKPQLPDLRKKVEVTSFSKQPQELSRPKPAEIKHEPVPRREQGQPQPPVARRPAPLPAPPPPPAPTKQHSWISDIASSAISAGLASLAAKNTTQQKQPGLLKTVYQGRSLQPAARKGSSTSAGSFNADKPKTFPENEPVKENTVPRPKFERSRTAPKGWWPLIKTTFGDFIDDKAMRLAAALAYYTVFSIAPLLLISIAVAGFFFGGGEEAAQTELTAQLERFLGKQGAEAIVAMLGGASRAEGGLVATLLGLGALLFGASAVFAQMKDALNTIWEIEPKPGQGIMATVRDRALSFLLVLVLGMLLLSSMLAATVLATVSEHLSEYLPIPIAAIHLINIAISATVVIAIFAIIFKYLPDAEISWKDVIIGAVVTTVLFLVGNYAIGFYISKGAVGSAYGAAGSVLIVLLWANYSSMIFLLGAEFTQAYALMYGSQIAPSDNAVMVEKRQ